jgi:hypothetical protein
MYFTIPSKDARTCVFSMSTPTPPSMRDYGALKATAYFTSTTASAGTADAGLSAVMNVVAAAC